jgi:hypothetical protein
MIDYSKAGHAIVKAQLICIVSGNKVTTMPYITKPSNADQQQR